MAKITITPTSSISPPVSPSSEPIEYAELGTSDLATFDDDPEARAVIAKTLRRAMNEQDFFTLINHGITLEEIERQVDIAYVRQINLAPIFFFWWVRTKEVLIADQIRGCRLSLRRLRWRGRRSWKLGCKRLGVIKDSS